MDISIVHPGEMGAAVAGALVGQGHTVVCALDGRSPGTRARARALNLTDMGRISALARNTELMISVCPSEASLAVAREAVGFRGVYVDANAISPSTAMEVAAIVQSHGATYVDGAIIGSRARAAGETRLYLSGGAAPTVAALFDGTAFDARVMPSGPYSASALKMMDAAWTEGTAALLLSIDTAARDLGVDHALAAEWEDAQPELSGRVKGSAAGAATSAGRWSAELEQVAKTFAELGLPGTPHRGGAELFARVGSNIASDDRDPLDRVRAALTAAANPAHPERKRLGSQVARGGPLSQLWSPRETMPMAEMLDSWGIVLEAGEAMRWFGACSTKRGNGFVAVSNRRLWFIAFDEEVSSQARLLDTIVKVDERGGLRRRLCIQGDEWEMELRSLNRSRSLSDLRAALQPAHDPTAGSDLTTPQGPSAPP
jgi:3-hydroxyisobutyrate dehydrogenase-like beta-hydroxyacid dehydrogenase